MCPEELTSYVCMPHWLLIFCWNLSEFGKKIKQGNSVQFGYKVTGLCEVRSQLSLEGVSVM